ncbi:thioredoxin family protein [Lysinibacillus sp. KU-BSD001]|uniref:thioredoxin family protein n=1 Tax=Lysinibacillus sp. KU-BSD001 TaxID=3141328 RepID=UPI0036E895DB
MEDWTKEQWQQIINEKEMAAFYLYTPMCGTCAVASKMLNVVEELLPTLPLGKANLNYMEDLAYDYEIESVPCLVIVKNGKIVQKVYAFQSVLNLYEMLKNN